MNEKPKINIGYVSPLKKICMTIGELPTSYLETMTYYEMLVWFVEFLKNQVIPVVNNNSEATKELQTLFIELQNYVNNYFDNLDVQDEINNKLDEMLEDGTFAILVERYMVDDILYLHKVGILPYEHSGDIAGYPNMQGGCLGKETNEFIQYQILNNTAINRLSIIDLETGETIRSKNLQLGHGNGVAYHNNKIYVTGGASDEYSKAIHIIDYETLDLIETISNRSYYGLTWSEANNCFYAMNFWSYTGESQYIYKLNENLELIDSKSFSMNIGKSSANIGSIGEYIGIISLDPSNIILFDKDMNFIKSITIERNIDFMHFASEIEWVNGKSIKEVYLGIRLFGAPGVNAGNHLIAKTSLTNSYQGGSSTISSVTNEFSSTIRVSSEDNWHWYEDGSADKPFNNPYLASNMAQIKELESLTIRFGVNPSAPISPITLPHTYNFQLNFKNCNPKIYLKSLNDSTETNDRITFTGKFTADNSDVDIHNINFGSEIDTYKITANNYSKVVIRRCNYTGLGIFSIDRTSKIVGDVNCDFETLEGSNILGVLTFNRYKSLNGLTYLSDTVPENTSLTKIENATCNLHPSANNIIICSPRIANIGILLTCAVPYNNTNISFYISTIFSPGHRSAISVPIGSNLMATLDVTNVATSQLWARTNFNLSVKNIETNEVIPDAVINYIRATVD